MLTDADRTLANWLGGLLPGGTGIRFDAPDARWATRPPGDAACVSAFLPDIRREDQSPRSGWTDVRDADGRVVGRQPPLQHMRLSYLLTAWAPTSADGAGAALTEHELLGVLLAACSCCETVPSEHAVGALAACGHPTLVRCAPPDAPGVEHLWGGLGISPRTCVPLVLVAPLLPPPVDETASPVREIVLDVAYPGVDGVAAAVELAAPPPGVRRWERRTVTELPMPEAGSAAVNRPSPSRSS
jgi:hypothetical protein